MVMKGGILLAVRYQSSRFTTDLDFSTTLTRGDLNFPEFRENLESSLAIVVADSDYSLDCRIQRFRLNPPKEDAQFSNLELSVGYAYKGSAKHKKLLLLQSPTAIQIDFNLNEPILSIEALQFGKGADLHAYAFPDLVAEKFRALIQQATRNRFRRQDVFDLNFLLSTPEGGTSKSEVLQSLLEKAQSRGIVPTPDSLADPEIRRRAQHDYATLADEVEGELPNFEKSYEQVEAYYRSLPWPSVPR
jgi:predicted nucleotidyltransferase component of viral defense system